MSAENVSDLSEAYQQRTNHLVDEINQLFFKARRCMVKTMRGVEELQRSQRVTSDRLHNISDDLDEISKT